MLLVWPLAAFGGAASTTAIPHAALCVLSVLACRSRVGGRLDRALLFLLAAIAVQMVSVPAALVHLLSPKASALGRTLTIGVDAPAAFAPFSIDVPATAWACAIAVGAVAMFWTARAQFTRGGVRLTTRLIAAAGFGVSLLAIAQAASAGRRIYWLFPTEFEGPLPFGPFVNRNHFATWIIMAIPLSFGYLAARLSAHREKLSHGHQRSRLVRSIDPRAAWLVAAGGTMLLALLLSLSRSGAAALGLSSLVTFVLARRRIERRHRRSLLAAAAVVIFVGVAWADLPALRERAAGAQAGLANRTAIWRETLPLVADFWLTGTGAGTYQRAMYVYQQSDRTVFFNQAHNHYLQVTAEGGIVLAGFVVAGIMLFVADARRRIADDRSALVWIRIGAACGLGAVAAQSVFETGLVMPANAALAATLAAIVVHERSAD